MDLKSFFVAGLNASVLFSKRVTSYNNVGILLRLKDKSSDAMSKFFRVEDLAFLGATDAQLKSAFIEAQLEVYPLQVKDMIYWWLYDMFVERSAPYNLFRDFIDCIVDEQVWINELEITLDRMDSDIKSMSLDTDVDSHLKLCTELLISEYCVKYDLNGFPIKK